LIGAEFLDVGFQNFVEAFYFAYGYLDISINAQRLKSKLYLLFIYFIWPRFVRFFAMFRS
jgi:hypothetical protein